MLNINEVCKQVKELKDNATNLCNLSISIKEKEIDALIAEYISKLFHNIITDVKNNVLNADNINRSFKMCGINGYIHIVEKKYCKIEKDYIEIRMGTPCGGYEDFTIIKIFENTNSNSSLYSFGASGQILRHLLMEGWESVLKPYFIKVYNKIYENALNNFSKELENQSSYIKLLNNFKI